MGTDNRTNSVPGHDRDKPTNMPPERLKPDLAGDLASEDALDTEEDGGSGLAGSGG